MTEAEALREFIREISIRIERGLLAISEDIRADVAARREESRRYFERLDAGRKADRERLDEILAEGRAGREALFRILDRFDGGGPATASS
jgi:hypothetical protein